jgi:hypothetical protein
LFGLTITTLIEYSFFHANAGTVFVRRVVQFNWGFPSFPAVAYLGVIMERDFFPQKEKIVGNYSQLIKKSLARGKKGGKNGLFCHLLEIIVIMLIPCLCHLLWSAGCGGAKKDLFPPNHRCSFAHINLFINLSCSLRAPPK